MFRKSTLKYTRNLKLFSSNREVSIDGKKILGIAIFSGISCGALYLGTWQMQRYNWKVGLMDEIGEKIKSPPATIPDGCSQYHLSEQADQLKGRRVAFTGKFIHAAEILLGPRSAPPGLTGSAAQGLAMNPQGYFVITPFQRNDGTVVFVNRGWVPINDKNSWSQPEGQTSINTIVSAGEKSGKFSPDNIPSSGKLFWLEPASLLKGSNLGSIAEPVVIVEVIEEDDAVINCYPVPRRAKHVTEQHVTPMTHLVYAVTWFSLAAAGFVMTFLKFRRNPHPSIARSKLRGITKAPNVSGNGGSL